MTDNVFDVRNDREEITERLLKENFMIQFRKSREKITGKFVCSDELLSLISEDCRLVFSGDEVAAGKENVRACLEGKDFSDRHFMSFEPAIQLNIFAESEGFPFGEPSLTISDCQGRQKAQSFVRTKEDRVSEIIFLTENMSANSVYIVPDECNPDTLISSGMAVNILNILFSGNKAVLSFIFENSDGETRIIDLNRQMVIRKGSMRCTKYLENLADSFPEGTGKYAQVFKTYELFAVRSYKDRGLFIWPKITNEGKFGDIMIRRISKS